MNQTYFWRILMKNVCFGIFGLGAIILSLVIFPLMHVFIPDIRKRDENMRKTIHIFFNTFVVLMQFLRLIKVTWNDKASILPEDSGCIITANHPSLIDIVILISRIPKGDCIVKHNLFQIPFIRGVVSRLYISNHLEGEVLINACTRSLEAGNTLIIFPEGTRNQGSGLGEIKRGAAWIALRSNQKIFPIHIETNDARGLRKGDGVFTYNKKGPIDYRINVGDYISSHNYGGIRQSQAARKLTNEIAKAIS